MTAPPQTPYDRLIELLRATCLVTLVTLRKHEDEATPEAIRPFAEALRARDDLLIELIRLVQADGDRILGTLGEDTGRGKLAPQPGQPMPPEGAELVYDVEIQPALTQVARACEARGMPFFALVGFAPDAVAETTIFPGASVPLGMGMARTAFRCSEPGAGFNIDRFVFAVVKRLHGTTHSSLVLRALGVPPEGEGVPPGVRPS